MTLTATSFSVVVLYFIQGVSYGFQIRVLPLYLRRAGFSYSELSSLRMLTLPWLFKCSLAPIVILIPQQRKLLATNVVLLAICFLIVDLTGIRSDLFQPLIFALNSISVLQDVALGQLLIEARSKDTALLGSWQILGYKLGTLFGGGLLFGLLDIISSGHQMFRSLSIIHLLAVIAITKTREKPARDTQVISSQNHGVNDKEASVLLISSTPQKNDDSTESDSNSVILSDMLVVARLCLGSFNTRSLQAEVKAIVAYLIENRVLRWLLLFSFLSRTGMQAAHAVFSLFLIDNAMPLARLSFLNGFCCQVVNILSSALAGYILVNRRWICMWLLLFSVSLAFVPLALQTLICTRQIQHDVLIIGSLSFLVEQVSAGISSTAANTLQLLYSKSTACKRPLLTYTLLSTLESIGKLGASLFSLSVVEVVGHRLVYLGCICCNALVVVLLIFKPRVNGEEISL